MKLSFKKSIYPILCVFAVLVPYMLLGPMEIYVGNILAFKFSWVDFVIPELIIVIAASIILGLLISLLPKAAYTIVTNALTVFCLLSYVQGMFMNTRLVQNDGNSLDFSLVGPFFYINFVIWIAVIVVFFVAAHIVSKNDAKLWRMICIGICSFLSAIQLVAFISLLLTTDANTETDRRSYQFSGDNQFTVSENDNILVLILDSYPNRFFDYACENNPEFDDMLSDFTYYTNADSAYIPTFPSISHMLTGGEFYYAESSDEWFHDVWGRDKAINFYDRIHDKGYIMNLYTHDTHSVIGMYEDVNGKLSNAVQSEVTVNKPGLVRLITKMSAYRYAPYVLKPMLEVLTPEYDVLMSYSNTESIFDNEEYLAALKEHGFSGDGPFGSTATAGVINVTHIAGLHDITKIDESLDMQNQVHEIIETYLNSLKAIGKYDDATIIITSDHGKYDFAEYQPIFFVKKSGETHDEINTSSAPISHDDFLPTVLYLTGNKYDDYGKSIFDYSEDELRTRTLHIVSDSEKTITDLEYTGGMDELVSAMSDFIYGK